MQVRARNETLEAQYRQQGEFCYYCKDRTPYALITRDHILPACKGHGFQHNKIFACRLCNNLKGSRSFVEFRALLLKRSIHILGKMQLGDTTRVRNLTLLKHHTRVIETIDYIKRNDGRLNICYS